MSKLFAGRHILVVEDEMMILLMLEELMIENGCASVHVASSIPQALELIGCTTFDAATLDVNLYGDESFPVADALEARGVPFLFMTGYPTGYLQSRYEGHPVMKKPFKEPDVVDALEAMFV